MSSEKNPGTISHLEIMSKEAAFQITEIENENKARDILTLASVGKKEVLQRRFGFFSMLGFSCVLMGTWEGLLFSTVEGLANGGPAGLVYGYFMTWIGMTCVLACLSELASMAPTSGGQYHWVAMLAPRSSQKILSYVTGWITVAAWQAALASSLWSAASLTEGILVLRGNIPKVSGWQTILLTYVYLLMSVLTNTVLRRYFASLEGLILILHILGFFAIIIPLTYLAPHGTASFVFTQFLNEGHWATQGLSFLVGSQTAAFAFSGADSIAHMSEEIFDAALNVPKAIMSTITVNGFLGFGILMTLLFSLGDLDAANNTPTGYPFIEIFAAATGIQGATVMCSIIVILNAVSNLSLVATASRQIWAFARDNGLPRSRYLKKVDPKTSLPLYSIALSTSIGLLIPLVAVGSTAAFNAIGSLTVSSFYASFLLSCYLLLWRRLRGDIASHRPDNLAIVNTPESGTLAWGPWRMPSTVGIIVNIIACIYVSVILIFSFWPQETPVTSMSMNYAIVMSGAAAVASLAFYILGGRKQYHGPIVEVSEQN